MKKMPKFGVGLMVLLAMLVFWQARPQTAWALTQDTALCSQCHIKSFLANFHHGLNQPDCFACHVSTNGTFLTECIRCHDFRGGLGVLTHDSHTDLIPVQIPSCETCHTDGVPGGPLREPFGECKTCHSGFQGGPSGTLHQMHTTTFGATDCATCHGTSAPACVECHQVGSTNPNFIGQMLHDFRNGAGDGHVNHNAFTNNNCQTCHVSGVPGGPLREPFSECKTCHSGFQGGPLGPLHLQHTTTFGAADCNTCHGDNAPACIECHQVGSTNPNFLGQMLHDFRNGAGEGHINHNTFTNNNCQTCHLSGVPGGPLPEPFGECKTCHIGFQGGPLGPLHLQHTTTFGAADCNTCHGDNAPACVECHQVGSTNPNFPGQMLHDFRNGAGDGHMNHNTFTSNNCQACHVSGVPGGPLREPFGECKTCHAGFQGGPFGPLHLQHTTTFGATDCNTCHGDNAPACVECHQVASTDPTFFGQMLHDFRNGAGDGHVNHNIFTNNTCQTCHVSGVPGGPLREPFGECKTCHTGFQGGPFGELHMQHTRDFGASDCNVCHGDTAPACTQCHAVDRHDFRGGGGSGHIFHNPETSFNCQLCHTSGAPGGGPLPPAFADCDECHTGFRGGPSGALHQQHTSSFGAGDCNICHGENAPACNQCHPGDRHHTSTFSQTGDCAHCHSVPASAQDRPAQAACRQCHGTNQHNKGGPIQNYGSCAACHDTMPFHATPRDSRGNVRGVGYTRPGPGKGTFNLFWSQITRNGQEQEDTYLEKFEPNGEDRDDEGGFAFSRPTISFNMVRITHKGQAYDVPAFSGAGGPVDPPPATSCSDYTDRYSCQNNGCDWSSRRNRCSSASSYSRYYDD